MTGEDVLPEKKPFKKSSAIKKSEYHPLGSEVRKHTDIKRKEYRGLREVYEFSNDEDKFEDNNNKLTNRQYKRSDLI